MQSIGMDDRKLTRTLSVLRKQLPLLTTIEQKRELASRAQHFIDRFTDVLSRGSEHDYTQVFFANQFIKDLQQGLPVPLKATSFA